MTLQETSNFGSYESQMNGVGGKGIIILKQL